jgi:hypothetical protein
MLALALRLASAGMIGLLQRRADRAKVGAELGADTLHGGNDGNRDPGGNQAVFDRSGTGFILEKRQNERLHGGSTSVFCSHGTRAPRFLSVELRVKI